VGGNEDATLVFFSTMSFDVFIGELVSRKHFHQKMEVVDNIESLTETDPDLYL